MTFCKRKLASIDNQDLSKPTKKLYVCFGNCSESTKRGHTMKMKSCIFVLVSCLFSFALCNAFCIVNVTKSSIEKISTFVGKIEHDKLIRK